MGPNPKLLIPVLLLFTFFFVVDILTLKGIKLFFKIKKTKLLFWIHWSVPILLMLLFMSVFVLRDYSSTPFGSAYFFFVIGYFMFFYLPKVVFTIFVLIHYLLFYLSWLFKRITPTKTIVYKYCNKLQNTKTILFTGFIFASLFIILVLKGIFIDRFNYEVKTVNLSFDNLPKEFDGLRIVQISDIHITNFNFHKNQLQKAVTITNNLKPDLILFTGDLVSNRSDEANGFTDIFKQLQATIGKYSILGNHDYGEYYRWKNEDEKRKNMELLYQIEKEMGFRLLRNESEIFYRGGSQIALIGIENWGKRPFPQYGDYELATRQITNIPFKILLSHDPDNWAVNVTGKTDVALTLSGHTHGMQFGIDWDWFQWSPVKWRYPQWNGLYYHENQYLYVNLGLGCIAFPGRIGIRPEITVFELKSAK